jgi:hypothetical protein
MASADQKAITAIQVRFAAGDYFSALKLADQFASEHQGSDFRQWLDSQMLALLVSAGWSHLKLGDCNEAIVELRRAEAISRTNEIAKGLAFCFRKQGSLFAAEDQAKYFLEKFSGDTSMDPLYLDILESLGDYDHGVEFIEERIKTNKVADLSDLKKRLNEMTHKSNEGIHEEKTRSQYFVLTHRINEHAGLAGAVLDSLEGSLAEFVENFGFTAPKTPIEVYLYPDSNFKKLVSDSPDWAEGLFDGRIKIPVKDHWLGEENPKELIRILRHELVHALFSNMTDSRSLPTWFDEGIAQRLSCISDGCLPYLFPPKPGNFMAREDLEGVFTSYAAIKAEFAYRQSLYLVLILENQHPDDNALKLIINGLTIDSAINSDALLEKAGMKMNMLIEVAQKAWQNQDGLVRREN